VWQYVIVAVIIVAAGLAIAWRGLRAMRGKKPCAGCNQTDCPAQNHPKDR